MSLNKIVSSGSKQVRHCPNVLGWTSVSSMSEWKNTDLRVLWFLICWKVSWDWVRKVATERYEDKCVGIWGLLHTSMAHHSEGLFTATHTVLESFTSLPVEVRRASSLPFCTCSVIVNEDTIMLSRPPLSLPREPHEESVKTSSLTAGLGVSILHTIVCIC